MGGEEIHHRQYWLSESYIGGVRLEVSAEDYDRYHCAARALLALTLIEELFEVAASSFSQFEKFLLDRSVDYMLGESRSDIEVFFSRFRTEFNLKTLNLLNAFRAYEEQYPQRLRDVEPYMNGITEAHRERFRRAYEAAIEYRVVYNLRNVAQHAKLPAHGFSIGGSSQWEGGRFSTDGPSRNRITVHPYFSVDEILDSDKLQAPVRGELESFELRQLDARLYIRRYVGEFSQCHRDFCDTTKGLIDRLVAELEEAYQRVSDEKREQPRFVDAICQRPNELEQQTHLKRDLGKLIVDYRTRWRGLAHVHRKFVSSELVLKKGVHFGSDERLWVAD
jgi:hypothetical protein